MMFLVGVCVFWLFGCCVVRLALLVGCFRVLFMVVCLWVLCCVVFVVLFYFSSVLIFAGLGIVVLYDGVCGWALFVTLFLLVILWVWWVVHCL